ncbi:hypothetical protein V6N13_144445 [Hibiscus sabdariffa]|uniref:BZIP domain-containing protein n=1 Tax=Hibiscus sabdariffa TaxID=183260 RepID=A0ABR2FKD2_9ROSI
MDRKNKNVVQQSQIPSATSAWPKYPIAATSSVRAYASANPFSFIMSPSKPPISPTSFNYMGQKPYFMKQPGVGLSAGASSSGTQASFFPGFNPFCWRGEKNKADHQVHFPPPAEKLILGPSPNTAVGNAVQSRGGRCSEQTMDPKKLKRVISNRLSAQRSRVRKLQHINDMEKKMESLQILVAVLSSQVQQQKERQTFLRNEQEHLQNQLSACANRRIKVDAEIEEKKAEVKRLRELQLTLQMRAQNMAVWEHALPTEEMPINPSLNNSGTGQPLYFSSDQVDGEEDLIAEEINRMNQLNLHQGDLGHMMLPGWEAGGGDFTNVGLDQSGPEQLQNSFPNQPQQQQIGNFKFNSGFGELEKIFNINPRNDSHIN